MIDATKGQTEERTSGHGVRWSQDWLGSSASLYRPESWRPATTIHVSLFRHILIWPLSLASDKNVNEDVLDTVRELSRSPFWKHQPDLFQYASAPDAASADSSLMDNAQRYAEFVYFHDFVQGILFRGEDKRDAALPPIALFRRKGITGVEATIELDHWTDRKARFQADVDRVDLYVFATGAAALVVELDFGVAPRVEVIAPASEVGPRPMSLADAETFVDHFRRAYTPFFFIEGVKASPAKVPLAVRWLANDADDRTAAPYGADPALEPSKPDDLTASLSRIASGGKGRRYAPVFAHWVNMIAPLTLAGMPRTDTPQWRHVVDERIPAMSFVSLTGAAATETTKSMPGDDLLTVSRGDWMRLCYADQAGGEPLPYAPGFLADFEKSACYDRYFPSPAIDSDTATRFMFAGYHFAVVGAGFFFDNLIVHHFRRHYFQIGLANHVEMASLLATSSRITNAVQAYRRSGGTGDSRRKFEDTILEIQEQFLNFVHLFRFKGISNQLQAGELHEKWRQALHLDELFEDVKTELEPATNFVFSSDQKRQTEAGMRLNLIALFGVVLGLAFGLLSMNVLVGGGPGDNPFAGLSNPAHQLAFGISVGFFGSLAYFASLLFRRKGQPKERSLSIAARGSATIGLIGFGLALWAAWNLWS